MRRRGFLRKEAEEESPRRREEEAKPEGKSWGRWAG
eukprot:CAMPEP_0206500370 /NCGR_PEP_ID=MMETSP0324_2-20121206/52395_1 /ASSEMBLY_ACC=CAM_ASM_000836 /TAXON_ID=2866 /ORGANISM="Crypthecodinium cohnii, Strain Seligo" /LENGTH=35 /DNA_ID= /DNA_START= /DNA_END= /DNA_ORIENTATION=